MSSTIAQELSPIKYTSSQQRWHPSCNYHRFYCKFVGQSQFILGSWVGIVFYKSIHLNNIWSFLLVVCWWIISFRQWRISWWDSWIVKRFYHFSIKQNTLWIFSISACSTRLLRIAFNVLWWAKMYYTLYSLTIYTSLFSSLLRPIVAFLAGKC